MKQIRILLVDDHGLMRLGLTALLKFHKDLSVVGGAENGKEAIALARQLKPDVIVMDLMMPVMDGVEATRRIHAEMPDVRIMILTTFGTSADVARQLGISTDAVKQHLNAICTKLGASNRSEAVAIALRKHLLKI